MTSCSRNPLGEDLSQEISNLGFTLSHNCPTTATELSAFNCQFQPSETFTDLTWSFSAANTCTWATVNTATGEITGTTPNASQTACQLAVSAKNTKRQSSPLVISVTISPLAPTLTISNPLAIHEDDPLTLIRADADVQANKEILGGSYSFDHATTTAPSCFANSTAMTINSLTGAISYQPALNYNGTCYIKVVYDDGAGYSNSKVAAEFSLVVIPVNDSPTLSVIANQTIAENTFSTINFTIADVDSALNCSTSISATSSNTSLLPASHIIFSGSAPNCTATLTPSLNEDGNSNITFILSDGSASVTQNFNLNVTPINNAPTIAFFGTYTFQAGQTLASPLTPTLGGGAPTSCTSSPTLPLGLVINPTTCAISGTPTVATTQQLFTITATNGFGSGVGTVDIGVLAALPNNSSITGVSSFTTSSCSLFTITARDVYGNTTSVSSDTTFNLTGAGVAGAFYSDSNCSSAISSVVMTNASSTTSFYYRKTTAGTTTLMATLASPVTPNISSASRNITVSTSSPARLGLVVAASGTTVSCTAVTINLLDSNNNPVNAPSNRTVNLAGTGSAAFYSDSGCASSASSVTITTGNNTALIYMRKTSAGSSTLTASSSGVANGTGSIVISIAVASRLRFSAVATIPYATSTCQAYTLQTRDSLNNNVSPVTADTTVDLSGASDGSFYSNSTCTLGNQITSTTITNGTSSRVIYYSKPTTTATFPGSNITLTASVVGWTPDATTSVNVSTGIPTNLGTINTAVGIAISSATNVTIANRCLLTTVRVHDEQNTLVPGARVLSNITTTLSGGGAGAQFWSNSTCTTPISTLTINAGTNTGNFYFSSTSTTSAVAISWTNGGLPGSGSSRNVTVSSGTPSRLTWTTAPTSFNTNTCQTYTFNVRDPNTVTAIGSNVSAVTEFQLSDGSNGTFYTDAGCVTSTSSIQVANSAQTANFYYRKLTAGSVTLSVSLQSPLNPPITTLNQAVTVAAPPLTPNNILISASPSTSLVANQSCSLITLQSRNGVTPANVTSNSTFTLSGTNGAQFFDDSGCTALASPVSLTILSGANTVSGLYIRTMNSGNVTISGSGPITVNNLILTYSSTPPTMLTLTGPSVMNAGISCGSFTVATQDSSGVNRNVASNATISVASTGAQTVQFYSNSSCSTPLPSNQVTVNSGTSQAVFYVRGSNVGSAQIQVSTPGLTSATQNLTVQ